MAWEFQVFLRKSFDPGADAGGGLIQFSPGVGARSRFDKLPFDFAQAPSLAKGAKLSRWAHGTSTILPFSFLRFIPHQRSRPRVSSLWMTRFLISWTPAEKYRKKR